MNGETLREGECRRLGEGDLVAAVSGSLEFTVRDLRMEVDGLGGLGLEGLGLGGAGLGEGFKSSNAGGTVDAMKCPIYIATVLPTPRFVLAIQRPSSGAATALLSALRPLLAACLRQPLATGPPQ